MNASRLRARKAVWLLGLALLIGGAAALLVGLAARPAAHPASAGDVRGKRTGALPRLPVGLEAAASSAIGAGQPQFAVETGREGPVARGGGLSTAFGASGPTVRAAGGRISLKLVGAGRSGRLVSLSPQPPTAAGSRVTYGRGALSEWYRNGPLGLEQGFTLRRRPAGEGRLTLVIRAMGALARRSGSGVVFARPDGTTILSYSGLSALDAAGRSLAARLELAGRTLRLRIDDSRARYPLTIDPLLQQGDKLTASDEKFGGRFGASVAISADGNTALIGGPDDDGEKGAVWTFVRSGSVWHQVGGKLTGSGESGKGRFGSSVALSANGGIALVGGHFDDGRRGAAWAYRRRPPLLPGLGVWKPLGGKLTPNDGIDLPQFARSVALSSNGAIALIGGPSDSTSRGAAWVFARSGSSWSQQGPKLTPSAHPGPVIKLSSDRPLARTAKIQFLFGSGVALSGDGNTALIGAPGIVGDKGEAWTFTRSGSTWSQQGGRLTGAGATADAAFGTSVALSADGSTALVGGADDDGSKGAAWAYRRKANTSVFGGAWAPLGGKLTGGGQVTTGFFGGSVALSEDGAVALIGGRQDNFGVGAAWVFARSGAGFSQQGSKLAGGGPVGNPGFGSAVALAADGNSALVGGQFDSTSKGAAWAFVNPPAVTSLSPASGPTGGGTTVTITGSGLGGAAAVMFGATKATSFKVLSPTQISAVAPPGPVGAVDVRVTTSGGSSAITAADLFSYFPGPPVPDTTPPTLTLGGPGRERVRRGSLFVLAETDEASTATATGTVSVPRLAKVYRLRSVTHALNPNAETKLTLKVPRRALGAIRKALGRHKRLVANITVTAKDRAGNATTKRRSIRLRA